MPTLTERLANREVILIDGGTGTELEKLDVPMVKESWTSTSTLTHPHLVQAVHKAYIAAGAELIITNTYSNSRHLMAKSGLEARFEEANRIAAQIAQQAKQESGVDNLVIAGSISTTDIFNGHVAPEIAYKNFIDQAQIQTEEGVDLFILEMLRDLEQTEVALKACLDTGLPVWAGFSTFIKDNKVMLFDGFDSLEEGVIAVKDRPIELIAIMHTLTEDIDASLDVVQKHWDGPIGVYAHSGDFIPPKWQFIDTISPEDYAENCLRWVKRGVQVIGGCCGIGPEHIKVLKARLPKHLD